MNVKTSEKIVILKKNAPEDVFKIFYFVFYNRKLG